MFWYAGVWFVGENGKTAVDALDKGLEDLMMLCEVVEEKFRAAMEERQETD